MTAMTTREERGLTRMDQHVEYVNAEANQCGWCGDEIPEHGRPVDDFDTHFCCEEHMRDFAVDELRQTRRAMKDLGQRARELRANESRVRETGADLSYLPVLVGLVVGACETRDIDLSVRVREEGK